MPKSPPGFWKKRKPTDKEGGSPVFGFSESSEGERAKRGNLRRDCLPPYTFIINLTTSHHFTRSEEDDDDKSTTSTIYNDAGDDLDINDIDDLEISEIDSTPFVLPPPPPALSSISSLINRHKRNGSGSNTHNARETHTHTASLSPRPAHNLIRSQSYSALTNLNSGNSSNPNSPKNANRYLKHNNSSAHPLQKQLVFNEEKEILCGEYYYKFVGLLIEKEMMKSLA